MMETSLCVLSAGRRMQYDTPDTVYNKPAALFVAGFTGSPAMNLAECTLSGGMADLGGVRLPLPGDLAGRGSGAEKVKFGVRPENIRLTSSGPDDIALPAEVSLLEPLGAETLVTFKIGASEMVARCAASFKEAPGARLQVHMSPRHLHLFDMGSGNAL